MPDKLIYTNTPCLCKPCSIPNAHSTSSLNMAGEVTLHHCLTISHDYWPPVHV